MWPSRKSSESSSSKTPPTPTTPSHAPPAYTEYPSLCSPSDRVHGDFLRKITEMRAPLSPLVAVNSGDVHSAFPKTLLHYWLLTESELDSLATFYHQTPEWRGHRHSGMYPKRVNWQQGLELESKRRLWGTFIGLRGCEERAWKGNADRVGRREEVRLSLGLGEMCLSDIVERGLREGVEVDEKEWERLVWKRVKKGAREEEMRERKSFW